MALQHLRASTADKRPTPAAMADGQLAMNTNLASPGLFFKDSNGDLVKVGPVHVGTTAPNATPASGGQAGNSKGEQWLDTSGANPVFKIWDGSNWISEAGEFVNASGDTMTGALVMDNQQQVRFREASGNGTNFIALQAPASVASDKTITLPDVTGTVVTTGDTGSVTSTMILDGTIVNADINASAAIAGTKVAPDFGSQTVQTTGIFSHALGTAGAPTVTFTGDTNTGIYSPGADQVAISTNGTGRLFIDSSGRALIGASTARSNFDGNTATPLFQIEGVTAATASASVVRGANDATGSTFNLGKTRATAVGGNTVVSSGDQIGIINFQAADGTNLIDAASIQAAVDGTPGANDMPGRLVFSTTSDNASSPTERMRLDSSGRLGLGTSSPGGRLHAVGTLSGFPVTSGTTQTFGVLRLGGSNTNGILDFGVNGTTQWIQSTDQTDLSQKYSLLLNPNGGNVGIGTTSPSDTNNFGNALDVNGTTGSALYVRTNGSATDFGLIGHYGTDFYVNNNSNGPTRFFTNGSERARIDSSGRLLVGTSSSRQLGGTSERQVLIESTTGTGLGILRNSNDDTPGILTLGKTRGTSNGSSTIVQNNDYLGIINFVGADGVDANTYGAQITCQVDGTPGANDMPGRLMFSTCADGDSSPTERMRISQSGVIETFSSVSSTIIARASAAANTSNQLFQGAHSATNTTNGTISFLVYTNGNVQNTNNSYGQISDIKLKENIIDAGSQWSDLKAVRVRNFNFKEGQTHRQIGVIAQELEEVSPGLVYETPDRDEDGNETGEVTKGVNYSVLYMKAVKALQEAMERIEQLESEMAEVKAQLQAS
jgi:hypothetical protein